MIHLELVIIREVWVVIILAIGVLHVFIGLFVPTLSQVLWLKGNFSTPILELAPERYTSVRAGSADVKT